MGMLMALSHVDTRLANSRQELWVSEPSTSGVKKSLRLVWNICNSLRFLSCIYSSRNSQWWWWNGGHTKKKILSSFVISYHMFLTYEMRPFLLFWSLDRSWSWEFDKYRGLSCDMSHLLGGLAVPGQISFFCH